MLCVVKLTDISAVNLLKYGYNISMMFCIEYESSQSVLSFRVLAERESEVFFKGEYVVSGNKGVCVVENITTLDISGVDKKREYYILKPVYMAGSTVYVPVDTAQEAMRKVLNREEAEQLIREIPEIPQINISNDKLLEQEYRSCIKTNRCEDLIRLIKTIHQRKQKRQEVGRKVTAVDARYYRIAEENLYGELAISLEISRSAVEDYIIEELDKSVEAVVR